MVGAEDFGINGRGGDLFSGAVGNKEIVDTPAGVPFAGFEHIAPPGVSTHSIGIQMAEGISEAGVQKLFEALTLFVGETGATPVGFGILQVDFLMGDVQITADDDTFTAVQLFQIVAEGHGYDYASSFSSSCGSRQSD